MTFNIKVLKKNLSMSGWANCWKPYGDQHLLEVPEDQLIFWSARYPELNFNIWHHPGSQASIWHHAVRHLDIDRCLPPVLTFHREKFKEYDEAIPKGNNFHVLALVQIEDKYCAVIRCKGDLATIHDIEFLIDNDFISIDIDATIELTCQQLIQYIEWMKGIGLYVQANDVLLHTIEVEAAVEEIPSNIEEIKMPTEEPIDTAEIKIDHLGIIDVKVNKIVTLINNVKELRILYPHAHHAFNNINNDLDKQAAELTQLRDFILTGTLPVLATVAS